MTQLTLNDIQNLLNVLTRTTFQGLEEAEVGVYLKHKLIQIGTELAERQSACGDGGMNDH